jgi:hypothetical protein
MDWILKYYLDELRLQRVNDGNPQYKVWRTKNAVLLKLLNTNSQADLNKTHISCVEHN